jgi:predicted nucleotidyltransferase
MVGVIADNLERIRAACAQRGVSYLDLVGSASRADFDPNRSDIDVLVDFPDGMNDLFDAYMGLREDLTRILGRHVDVIMGRGVRNPLLLASLRDDAVRLYAA